MKLKNRKSLSLALSLLLAFALWTVAVACIDVKAIGPEGTRVGFSALNGAFHKLTGVNLSLYSLTDLLSFIPLGFVVSFGITGLFQLIKRKSILKVDTSILCLGVFYVVVFAIFVLFEVLVINYRPILIEGQLEASYPSSTTMFVLCIMPTAIIELNSRLEGKALRITVAAVLSSFTLFMVLGRLISGVHWLSDIIGGALLSAGLVFLYRYFSLLTPKKDR